MAPRYFGLRSPATKELELISYPPSRPLTYPPFAPRSTLLNKAPALSPAMIGGLVAIVILALLCAVGVGLALHVHHCRHGDCSVCSTVARLTRSRSHSTPAHEHSSSRLPETLCDREYLVGPSIQASRMSSQTCLPSLAPPPTHHTHRQKKPEMAMPNFTVFIRGSRTPPVISDNCAPTLGPPRALHSHPSPRKIPTPLERKLAHPGRTLARGSNLSEDISIITLPSFVEHERCDSIPSPMLSSSNLSMVEGVRSLPPSRRSSFLQPSRSRSGVTNTMAPTTPFLETHLSYDFPSPSLSVPDRQIHLPHRTRSRSSRRAGARRELVTAKLKSVAQAEVVKKVQPGTPETPGQLGTNNSRPNVLWPLKILTHVYPFLGNYDSGLTDDQSHPHEERDAGITFYDFTQPVPFHPSQQRGALRVPVKLEGAPPTLSVNDITEPSPSYQSPVLGFLSSPKSHSSPDEKRSRVISQARSPVSTILSLSAFPSPPDFTPGPVDNPLYIANNYSTSGRTLPPPTLWEGSSVRSVGTASPNEGQTSTPPPDPDTSRPMSTVNPRTVFGGHLHPKSMDKNGMPTKLGVSFMRRLSRVPLGPRQMSGMLRPPRRRTPQPLPSI